MWSVVMKTYFSTVPSRFLYSCLCLPRSPPPSTMFQYRLRAPLYCLRGGGLDRKDHWWLSGIHRSVRLLSLPKFCSLSDFSWHVSRVPTAKERAGERERERGGRGRDANKRQQ